MKRFVSMALAVVMAISVMSSSALAAPSMRYSPSPDYISHNEVRCGVLSNGIRYEIAPMTLEEIEAMYSEISTYSYSHTQNYQVPIANAAGTNGVQLGHDFVISPDTTVVVSVGNLPSTMPTVNIGLANKNGMWQDWAPNVSSNEKVTFTFVEGDAVYTYQAKASTSEVNSKIARFTIETE